VVNRYEQFVDAKRVVGSHKSKKGRQCNGQAKKDKMINIGLQKTTLKTEDCFVLFRLTIALPALLRFMTSDNPFGIYKLFVSVDHYTIPIIKFISL
jgi:hypothetical protein